MLNNAVKEFFDYFIGDKTGEFVFNGGDMGGVNIDLYTLFIFISTVLTLYFIVIKPLYRLLSSLSGKKGK